MYSGKTNEELWRGDPEEFQRRSQERKRITRADVEMTFENARHSSDRAVVERFAAHLSSMTDDALGLYGLFLTDDDEEKSLFLSEVERRKCTAIRLRPGTRLARYAWYVVVWLSPDWSQDTTSFSEQLKRLQRAAD